RTMPSLALAIASARDGIVLIDEIENGFHYSIMPKVWQAIASFSRQFNVQVFATTHSYECIQAAHEAFEADSVYDFRLHRLERVKGKIKAITYSQGALNASLEADWEVR
ncbi:MAG: AAA family ATPase, partial [Chloroflexi bacterium]|nr:AAA family ATPase [Chloroflexota bacterium]